VFIYICVPLLFIERLFNRSIPAGVKAAFAASLAASLVAYALLALLVIPAFNRVLGQVPIDLWGVVARGVYDTMFLSPAKPVAELISNVSPGWLLETMLSVHTVSHRLVRFIWTSGDPLPHF
jgi:hypothetical protein